MRISTKEQREQFKEGDRVVVFDLDAIHRSAVNLTRERKQAYDQQTQLIITGETTAGVDLVYFKCMHPTSEIYYYPYDSIRLAMNEDERLLDNLLKGVD